MDDEARKRKGKREKLKTEDAVRPTLMLFLLLVSILALPLAAQSEITGKEVYIRADGSVSPPEAPIRRDGDVYTLTGNIYNSIVVERDNITVDGAFYTLQGAHYQDGIVVNGRRNVLITNIEIRGFSNGLVVQVSRNITVLANVIVENAMSGVFLNFASNNSIIGDRIANNGGQGVRIDDGSNNTIFHNNFIGNFRPVLLTGSGSNVWDDGYPSGGNYWNDNRIDMYSGPYQNETGGDGVGDTPYFINSGNQDRYPLVSPYTIPQMLFVSINFYGSIPFSSGETVGVQVHVTCGNSSVEDALVEAVFVDGSVSGFSGRTDAYGYFTTSFTAPTVATYTRFEVLVNATKPGFLMGQGETQLAVQPSYPEQEPYYQPYGSQGVTVVSGPSSSASFTSALFNTLLSLAVLLAVFIVLAIVIAKAAGGRGPAQKRQRRKIIIP